MRWIGVLCALSASVPLFVATAWARGEASSAAPAPEAAKPEESYAVELKIIEAFQTAAPDGGSQGMDPQLAGLAKELKTLPFKGYSLWDGLQKDLRAKETFTMQFGRPERKRFLKVMANGKKAGKVLLNVSLESERNKQPRVDFKSEVSITEGSTLVVVANRSKPGPRDSVILLAITAHTLPPAHPAVP